MSRRTEARKRREAALYRQKMLAGKPLACTGIRSHVEVAAIMTARGMPMSRTRVYQIERKAIAKLREALADLACDFAPEEVFTNHGS